MQNTITYFSAIKQVLCIVKNYSLKLQKNWIAAEVGYLHFNFLCCAAKMIPVFGVYWCALGEYLVYLVYGIWFIGVFCVIDRDGIQMYVKQPPYIYSSQFASSFAVKW